MSPDALFQIVNPLVLPGWALLIFAPRWAWTQRIAGAVLPLVLALFYLVTLVTGLREGGGGGFDSLQGVATLFQSRMALLAGWIHYLAFDLFIGAWEVRDAQQRGLRHWLVVPCLLLTFLFGPVGLLCYFGLRRRLLHL
jgi:Domain of unknown function (DUF4281)